MVNVFVLYNNPAHNFGSIFKLVPQGAIIHFLFSKKDLETLTIESCKTKLEEDLDRADKEKDFIVLNGPSYMAACAGYVWFTQEREKYNIIAYNTETRTYELKENA